MAAVLATAATSLMVSKTSARRGGGGYENDQSRSFGTGRSGYRAPAAASDLAQYGLQLEPNPPGVAVFGTTRTAKMTIEAGHVGAVIGKAGANVKFVQSSSGARVAVRENEDPTKKTVEVEGSLDQIEAAASIIRQFLADKDSGVSAQPSAIRQAGNLGAHNFKTRLCERYQQGTCTFGDRCHFAHGTAELR
eukprot:jgi/Mesen1/6593/ME000338S05764